MGYSKDVDGDAVSVSSDFKDSALGVVAGMVGLAGKAAGDGRTGARTSATAAAGSSCHQRRLSAGTELSDELSISGAVHQARQALTVLWDELPSWRQDNHYIVSGYRPLTGSFKGCLHSLLYMHNESVNIYSHLVGSVVFLVALVGMLNLLLPRYATTSGADFAVFVVFFLGAVACLGMSSTYHCLNCHSEQVAKFGNQLDYLGIVFLIVGSFIPAIYYGLHSIPSYYGVFFGLVCGLGAVCIVITLRKEFASPRWRPFRALLFVVFGLSGIIPITFGGFRLGLSELSQRIQLPFLVAEGLLYIGGATIYAMRVPERFSPGKFDLVGSSHQIFHLCVIAAAVSHLVGMVRAYRFLHGQRAGF
ncbi:hemolysin-III related-domain-containing protein [Dipodascopsis tothii]|uniref:hemolysin-III related-domain-containing protein n=1 Tax=Dipodascopsis tothii TaxID=44089 RepID=UPI0034CD5770